MMVGQKLSFEKEDLNTILLEIEQKTPLSFNYDPSLLEGHTYDGTIELKNAKDQIDKLLYLTPLTFEAIGNNILIILPDKRNYEICGWIRDKSYKTNLLAANVYAEGIDLGTLTDESGYFELVLQAYKNQKITISYIGYVSTEIMIADIVTGECKEIYLENDQNLLGTEIVIKDYIHPGITEGESYNSTSMDIKKTIRATSHDEHDILRTVQVLPGITSLDESAGNLTIRGSTPDQNMLVWEQATLYDSGHMFGMISTVNPFVLDKVNVYKGVFRPSFDNRIGGLVEMSLPADMPSKISGGVGTTLSEGHAHLSLPVFKNRLGFIFSMRRSMNNVINSPTINRYTEKIFQRTKFDTNLTQDERNYRNDDDKINFSDINLKIFFSLSKRINFKSSFIFTGNEFNSFSLFDDNQSQDFINENTLAFSNELSFQWSKKANSTFSLIVSDYNFNYFSDLINYPNRELAPGEVFIDSTAFSFDQVQNNITDLSMRLSNSFSLSSRSNLRIDFSADSKYVSYNIEEGSGFRSDLFEFGFQNGIFTNMSVAYDLKTEKFQLMVGSKVSYYGTIDKPFFSPRVSTQYLISEDLKLKASAGKVYQFVSQLSLNDDNDLGSLRNFWIMANEDSDEIMNANKFSLGFISNIDGWLIDVEAYYNKNKGLSSLSADLNAGVELEENGESTALGIETLVKKRWNAYTMWLNYTLSESKYFFPDTDMKPFAANNDHRHNLSILNTYNFKDLTFSLNYNFRSGLPYSSPSSISIVEVQGEINYSLKFDQLNDQRLDNYHRFDVGVTYRKSLFKNLNMEANLSFVNILDAKNIYTRNSILIPDANNSGVPMIETYDKKLLRRTPKFLFRIYW